ncbi:nitrate/nitrite transporter NrtS [Pseudorhodoplanes sp.]|uniref:nitrate/nitrite transporter NrtS n=1 Tax=Pseudorhodoplanes sp. TaxID=1934341 RepID=UPI003D0C49D6
MSISASERHDLVSKITACLQCAISDGIPLRSIYVAVIVGTVLNLINQGDALFGYTDLNWAKLLLTYCVPYLVATYGAVAYKMRVQPDPSETTDRC